MRCVWRAEIGYPVAVKIDSPDILHKTEVGGVYLGARDSNELAAAYKQVTESVALKAPGAKINGILIQEMVNDGIELIVGMHRDRQFGPVILVGLGGVLAELLNDVSLRLCPLDCARCRGHAVGAQGRALAPKAFAAAWRET